MYGRSGIIKAIIKKIKEKKHISFAVAALIGCLVLLSVFITFMPKANAAGEDINNPIPLTPGVSTNVGGDQYYVIGDAAGVEYTTGFTLNYQDNGSGGKVYLIIRKATFNLSSDTPAITIKAKNLSANVEIILDGESQINGIAGANQPLIKAENYVLTKLVVNAYASTNEEFFTPSYITQDINLAIRSIDNTSNHSLTLLTGAGSYGAAIGSAESQTMVNGIGITLASGSGITATYPIGSNVTNPVSYTNGEEILSGDLDYGAADVDIKSGMVNFTGQGYGAGIGLGGSRTNSVNITTGFDSFPQSVLGTLGSVKITNGTVAAVMSPSSLGSVFMNAVIAGGTAAADGRVIIDGGSVYIKRQNKDTILDPYTNAYNTAGEKLFLYTARFVDDNVVLSNSYSLFNDCQGEEEYTYLVNGLTKTPENNVQSLSTSVALSAGNYLFDGFIHKGSQYGQVDRLYFYLPTTVLNRHDFSIKSDGRNDITYSYFITDPGATVLDPIPTQYTGILEEANVEVKQGKRIYIRLDNLPSYTKSISFNFILTNTGFSSSGSNTILTSSDGSKYTYFDILDADAVAEFTYTMESFNITYNMGLLAGDESASINNPNPGSYECGKTLNLLATIWDAEHVFAGWTDAVGNPITSVNSATKDENITVYAKWECNVNYIDDGNILKTVTLNYGDYITNANNPASPLSTQLVEFLGWSVQGNTYADDETYSVRVQKSMDITAVYKRIGYYVYIKAMYIDKTGALQDVDIRDYSSFNLVYENNLAVPFSTMNSQFYYRSVGFVDRTQDTLTTLVPKSGYKISGKDIRDAQGNPVNLVASENDMNAFSFTMPEVDVYMTIYIKAEDFTITYYDVDSNINILPPNSINNNNPGTYNFETESFLFNPPTTRGKYYHFEGWYELSNPNVKINGVTKGSTSRNLILFSKWSEVPLYDIELNADPLGDSKVFVEGIESLRAAEGETVTISAATKPGIKLLSITYSWINPDGSVLTNTKYPDGDGIDEIKNVSFIMPAVKVIITTEFEEIDYNINYINLIGATNENPLTYTVSDDFTLNTPVLKNHRFMGWKLILPDTDPLNFDDVKMEDITEIKNRTGNLLITATWEEENIIIGDYNIAVDENITKGIVNVDKTLTKAGDYIFVRTNAEPGYRVSNLSYEFMNNQPVYTMTFLSSLLNLSVDTTDYNIINNKLADDLYYFVMVDKDVVIKAVFTPITYNITYIDEGQNTNVKTYTIEDDITLIDPVREGYKFLGWVNEDGDKVQSISGSFGDVTLRALWEDLNPETTEVTTTNNSETTNNNEATTKNGNSVETKEEETTLKNNENIVTTAKKKNSFVGDSSTTTGDKVDVFKFAFISLLSVVIIVLILFMKKKSEDKE